MYFRICFFFGFWGLIKYIYTAYLIERCRWTTDGAKELMMIHVFEVLCEQQTMTRFRYESRSL